MIEFIHISKTPEELANAFAAQLLLWIDEKTRGVYHIALSGGNTPSLLFSVLTEKYKTIMPWQKIHFWWGDERMVLLDNQESNFGVARDLLFSKITIPPHHIHRIRGETNPSEEVKRYGLEIESILPLQNHWPLFDLILLGLGEDGHIASIFPDRLSLFESDQITDIAIHPVSGQLRITLTGKVLNNSAKVAFLVAGKSKARILNNILHHHKNVKVYPASYILPRGELHWFVDEASMTKKPTDY